MTMYLIRDSSTIFEFRKVVRSLPVDKSDRLCLPGKSDNISCLEFADCCSPQELLASLASHQTLYQWLGPLLVFSFISILILIFSWLVLTFLDHRVFPGKWMKSALNLIFLWRITTLAKPSVHHLSHSHTYKVLQRLANQTEPKLELFYD